MTKDKLASSLFREGYNCAQAVLMAFAEELGAEPMALARLAAPFGGGMGRMREVCGAVSALLMLQGMTEGYTDISSRVPKKECYARVQKLMRAFADEMGSFNCRELLGAEGAEAPEPAVRDEAYYQSRPCERCCMCAARLGEKLLKGTLE